MENAIMQNIIAKLEKKSLSFASILLTVVTIGIFRNTEEHILKGRRIFGFEDAYMGTQTYFIHYNLFWLVTFFFICFILFILTKKNGNTYRNCLVSSLYAFPLILLPPAFDVIIGNYDFIGYPNNPLEVLYKIDSFLNVKTKIYGITPGMRYEIFIACILVFIYIYVKKKNIICSLAGFFLCFSLILLLGLWVSFTAQMADHTYLINPSFRIEDSVFYKSGIVFHSIVQKISSILFIIFLLQVLISAYLLDGKIVKCIIRNFRFTRSLHYLLLYTTGFVFAFTYKVKHSMPDFPLHFFDYLAFIIGGISIFLAFQSAVIFNDLYDSEIDKVSNARRPLPMGSIRENTYKLVGFFFLFLSLLAAFLVNHTLFALVIVYHAGAFLYSCPPFRLRNHFFSGNLLLSLIALISFHGGASLIFSDFSFTEISSKINIAIVFGYFIAINIKDIKDIQGDTKSNVRTLFTSFRPSTSKLILSVSITILCFLLPFYLQVENFYTVSFITTGLFNFFNYRRKTPEYFYFLIYFLYVGLLFYFIINSPLY